MDTIDEAGMQRLLAAVNQQQQQQTQKVLDLQQQQADLMTTLTQAAQNQPQVYNSANKVLHARDLPQFSAQAMKIP